MKKKIAIVGAGISGLVFANLLKDNSKYEFTIYEKNSSLDLSEGYGVQLSVNSVSVLNKIGFNNMKLTDKFNPEKIDFYTLKNNKKICDLDISQFNSENILYTTLKRSLLIKHLKEKLFTDSIQFNKKILKIKNFDSKIKITFEKNIDEIFDYLIISDGVFSVTKSILFNKDIKAKYFGSLAFRALIEKQDLKFINEKNISLFIGSGTHVVIYPISDKNEFNLAIILRKKLKHEILNNRNFFEHENNIAEIINKSPIQKNINLRNIFNNAKNLKCFPIFISDKIRKNSLENIFFLGDAYYSQPPTFAQGASQAIEAADELYNILNNDNKVNIAQYSIQRTKKTMMVERRSKINYFIFHISNPILVIIRNAILKIAVKNRGFLNKYLGKIYLKKS